MKVPVPWSRVPTGAGVETGDLVDRGARFGGRFRGWALVGAVVWLVFLVPVAREGLTYGGLRTVAALATLVVFVAAYLWVLTWRQARRALRSQSTRPDPGTVPAYLGLLGLAVTAVLVIPPTGLSCVVYVAVAGIFVFPPWVALGQSVVLALVSESLARVVPGWSDAQGIGLSVFLASFAVWGIAQAIGRSMDLVVAQEENAQLMVGQERTRMARDLHDILGHSLTVITIKAELAGRMLDAGTDAGIERARAELADLERLSRDALADVRRTVEGYRDLTLPGEIARARVALEAAEVEAVLPGTTDEVASPWRELFAWTVREGVTNVVRHSGARHCTVSIGPDHVRVADDGRGCGVGGADGGNGLVGLRERAAAVGARVVTHSPTEGGFVLTVHASVSAPVAPAVVPDVVPDVEPGAVTDAGTPSARTRSPQAAS